MRNVQHIDPFRTASLRLKIADLKVAVCVGADRGEVGVRNLGELELLYILGEAKDLVCDTLWCRLSSSVVEFDSPVLLWAARVVAGTHDETTCKAVVLLSHHHRQPFVQNKIFIILDRKEKNTPALALMP